MNDKSVNYLDSLGVEHIPKPIRKSIKKKNITTHTYRIQACDSISSG